LQSVRELDQPIVAERLHRQTIAMLKFKVDRLEKEVETRAKRSLRKDERAEYERLKNKRDEKRRKQRRPKKNAPHPAK
jgi:hypothetical protein